METQNAGGVDALLPCPFCGERPHVANRTDEDGCFWAFVRCDKCGVQTRGKWASSSANTCPIFFGEVRYEWNTRALSAVSPDAATVDDVAVLRLADEWERRCKTPECNSIHRMANRICADELRSLANGKPFGAALAVTATPNPTTLAATAESVDGLVDQANGEKSK